jgi:hypothetical protein
MTKRAPAAPIDLSALERARAQALMLSARRPLGTNEEAERFLNRVGIALRYGPAKSLPIASLYRAASTATAAKGPPVAAIELTNHLLGAGAAIEVNVIGDRLTLVHRSMMPELYALVRRGRPVSDLSGLSMNARAAAALIRQRREVTAGDVRAHLGLKFDERHDPGYEALNELQRMLLVDRGPFEIRKTGIAYLSKEGYPNHFFHEAHPELVELSKKLSIDGAADRFLQRYLDGSLFCAVRTLKAMFKRFLMSGEIDESLERLAVAKRLRLQKAGATTVAITAR